MFLRARCRLNENKKNIVETEKDKFEVFTIRLHLYTKLICKCFISKFLVASDKVKSLGGLKREIENIILFLHTKTWL